MKLKINYCIFKYKIMKRKHEPFILEHHYYKEVEMKIMHINDENEQNQIDKSIEEDRIPPPSTTRESGYSTYLFKGSNIEVNTSLVKKRKLDEQHYSISRAIDAPVLPVSCLASTEHIVALQNKVTDFKSEFEPEAKNKVSYLISLSCNSLITNLNKEKKTILNLILAWDPELNQDDIRISYNKKKFIFEIRASTQLADIQLLVCALTQETKYNIVQCKFKDIGLNQGICLVKKDGSDPVHALVNIANSEDEKGFIERDAGATTGLNTATYQDRNWTFNFFSSLEAIRKKNNFPEDALAIKIFKGN